MPCALAVAPARWARTLARSVVLRLTGILRITIVAPLAVPSTVQPRTVYASLNECIYHARSTVLGEPQVVIVVAALIGVALNFHQDDLWVADERTGNGFDNGHRVDTNARAVRLEI